MPRSTRSLTPEQIARYRRDGILFPIPALADDEVARFSAAIVDLEKALKDRIGHPPEPSDMSQPQLHFRWAWELSQHPAVLDAVEDLLGRDILVHSASIFDKAPRSGSYVSWHQDGVYWGLSEPALVSAWIALTESTTENGCLQVVPGSHKHRSLPFRESERRPDNLLRSGLRVDIGVDESQVCDVLLQPGEMSLHHVDLIHGSGPNRSDGRRTGFAVRYLPARTRQQLAHHDVLVVRGQNANGHYTHLAEPPSDDRERSLKAQMDFAIRWRAFRLGDST